MPKPDIEPRPAAFLDRDGTIIVEREYLGDPAGVELMPGVADAIRMLNNWGYWVIGVSNQSGIARGYYGPKEVDAVNRRVIEVLAEKGAHLDHVYYCSHLPEVQQARGEPFCTCRKPAAGMIEQARAEFAIEMRGSFVVGDQISDIGLAHTAGIPGILVRTGFGQGEQHRLDPSHAPAYVADDLLDAVTWYRRSLGLTSSDRT